MNSKSFLLLNRQIITAVLFFSLSMANAQSLKQYIPENSTMVMGVNWARLESKLSFSQINNATNDNSIDNPFMELLVKIMDNPKQFGLDLKEQTYFFHHVGDTFNNQVMVLAIANKSIFMEKALEWFKRSDANAEFTKTGNEHYYAYGKMAVSCTNDLAIVLIGTNHYGYYRESYAVEEERSTDFNYWSERRKTIRQIDSFRNSDNDPYAEIMNAEEEEEDEVVMQDEVMEVEGDYYEEDYETQEYEVVEDAAEAEEYYEEQPGIADEENYEEDYVIEEAFEYEERYNYDKHPLMKALNKKREEIEAKAEIERKKKEAKRLKGEVKRYLTLEANQTNAKNAKFNLAMNNDHDLTLWVNPNIMHNMFSKDLRRQMIGWKDRNDTAVFKTETSFDRLMRDNFNYAYGDFNEGSFKMTYVQERNKELQEYAYINTAKINGTMLNYLDEQTFGYLAANLSISDFFETYRKVMNSMIESMPLREQYTATFEMMDIFINKDIFYNTLKGDGIFAFTGITTKIETRTKYVYNEETFKKEYKDVSDTTLIPEMLFMGSIAKQENVDRLILAMEHMGLFKKIKNNAYEVMERRDGKSTSFYIAHHNGILFVTNSRDIVFKYLESGLPKGEQISGQGKELLTKYGNCQYWDSQKSFDAILSLGTHFQRREKSKLKVLQTRLSTSTVYSVSDGNNMETHATLNFSDSSINALTELVNLMHELEIAR